MPNKNTSRFHKSLIALTAGFVFTPASVWSLDLVQAPPMKTSKSAFVPPNVIISIDDSGSMRYCLSNSEGHSSNSNMNSVSKRQKNCWVGTDNKGKDIIKSITEETAPINGVWPVTARRINVLKYALRSVFNDEELIPENKIRIAWQAMNSSSTGSFSSSQIKTNSMQPIDKIIGSGNKQTTHRENFLKFVNSLSADGGTPSHKMFSQADAYMRAKLNKNGPWSTDPGGTGSKSTEYLGCRRNYHIMMTDGRWNDTATSVPNSSRRDNATNLTLEDGTIYSGSDSALYRDESTGTTLADWAFYSWATPLQSKSALKDADTLKPSKVYDEAIDEQFGSGTDIVTLKKFWNPKYNPATWPHMVTYTIGFSESAFTWDNNQIIAPSQKSPFGYDGSFARLAKGDIKWPNLTKDTESDNALDLWHAALNGRGQFYAVEEGTEMEQAFRNIIGKINEENAAPQLAEIQSGGAASGYSVSQNNSGIFSTVFNINPNANWIGYEGWTGYVAAVSAVEPEEYNCPTEEDDEATCFRFENTIGEWEGKTTADRLDNLDATGINQRLILTWGDKSNSGAPFRWEEKNQEVYLSSVQKASLGLESNDDDATVANKGVNILNYVRGDQTLEPAKPPQDSDVGPQYSEAKPMRMRLSRQGDIVNSQIWYTGSPTSSYALGGYADFIKTWNDRLPMLYVGGNDGMLHGFSAKDGTEKLAYVPRGVIARLKELTDPDYEHRYYVDGSPMTGDIKDGDDWKTVLVGTLGAGGKGYFVLDVTNPENFSEANAANLVLLDRTLANGATAAEDAADIGNITAEPNRNPANLQETAQITRMNNGRWAAVMGNGYNSTNRRPVLLVQYLDGDRDSDGNLELKRIQTTTDATNTGNAFDNGLSTPTLVDLNGDGMMDIAYAGDNLGNLWKFDLTSDNDNDWTVAFGYNKPLFTARGPAALGGSRTEIQPITAPPIVRYNSRLVAVGTGANARTMTLGGLMVAFGTGRNLTSEDRRTDIDQNIQTLYSVLDNTRYRKRSGSDRIEIYENGQGNCESGPATCVPKPEPVGTISSSGMPLAKRAIAAVEGEFATINAAEELDQESWNNYKGWYLDFPSEGERLLKPMQFYDSSNILAVYSESPSGTQSAESDNINESCVPIKTDTSAGKQWRTLINILDGKTPTLQLMFKNDTDLFDGGAIVARMSLGTGTPTLITSEKYMLDYTGRGVSDEEPIKSLRMPEQSMRPSWRQLN